MANQTQLTACWSSAIGPKRQRSNSSPDSPTQESPTLSDIVSMITNMQLGITAEIKSVKSEVAEEFKAVNQRIDHQF